jgi:hypothetical protein
MNHPRTPQYFPAMKVRGARRRKIAPIQHVAGAFTRLGIEAKRAGLLLKDMAGTWGIAADTKGIKESI